MILFFSFFGIFANKNSTAPNLNFLNKPKSNEDSQVRFLSPYKQEITSCSLILGYKLISTSVQSPKNVIKAKDPRLHQINVAVPGFLSCPPSAGIHQVELPT